MKLPDRFIIDRHSTQAHTLRLLHYPPLQQSLVPNQRWSNDVFRSTKHRVMVPTSDRKAQSRSAIAFFCQPNYDTEISCIESCQSAENPPRYEPVLAGEYLIRLLQSTY